MSKFEIDLSRWEHYDGTPISDIIFSSCSNVSDNVYAPFTELQIINIQGDGRFTIKARQNGNLYTYDENTYDELLSGSVITFDASVYGTYFDKIITLVNNELLGINLDGNTTIMCYRQNSENDALSKTLIGVTMFDGKFNHAIGFKNINIDLVRYIRNFNYVYIPTLERYYFVDSIELVSANVTRLHLKEDVLMSWKDLIKSQKAFVTRYENSSETNIVDNRLPYEDTMRVVIDSLDSTPIQNSKVNVALDYNLSDSKCNFLITTFNTHNVGYASGTKINTIDSGNLPTISNHESPAQRLYLMSHDYVSSMFQALINDDATASYLVSILWLPFDPVDLFNLSSLPSYNPLYIGEKKLKADTKEFVNYNETIQLIQNPICYDETSDNEYLSQIPYIVVFDGKYTATDSWKLREPYTYYEIHIPFVGFVKLDAKDFLNQRIIIYYSLDAKSGASTCYVYNYDRKTIIWSGTCQMGIKVDITSTNTLENTKQKQSAELNMILGLISSATSIGIGVATENPVAIVGGVLSASKTIASNVNINRMIFERTQTNFGTSDGALFDVLSVFVKVIYHNPISIHTDTYKHMQGLPYNNYVSSMSTLSGYVEVGEIHFDPNGKNIYQDEISEIVQLLQNGVTF